MINFVLFQVAWFACILGAAGAMPWLGVLVVTMSALYHLRLIESRGPFLLLLCVAALLGVLFDGASMMLGLLGFPDEARLLTPVPLWMLCMWVNLALTLPFSLAWLRGRYVLACVFGLIGGPGAYYTGMKLGAVYLGTDLMLSLAVIGIEWAIAMPLLLYAGGCLNSIPMSKKTTRPINQGVVI